MPDRPQRRLVSIRWSLFKNLLFLIVLFSGSLLIYSVTGANRTIRHLSASVIGEATTKVENKLAGFFAPISKTIEIVRELGARSVFTPDDLITANDILIPVLSAFPQMSTVNTGNERGDALFVVKRKHEWLNISLKGGPGTADWSQVDESGRILRMGKQELDFDPRTRPWYQLVKNSQHRGIHWTEPYAFVPTGDLGITAAVAVREPKDPYILAFDILLEDLSEIAKEIQVSPHGITFVLTEDGRLLVPPSDSGLDAQNLLLKRPEETGLPLVAESIRLRTERPRGEPFLLQHNGETWWCGFQLYQISPERKFWIGVLIPEQDLLGDRQRDQIALLILTIGALLIAALMALALSRAYSAPLRKLVAHSARLQRLQTDVEVRTDSRLKEVWQLASAQENMRSALDSFARYVPVDVVRQLLSRGEAATVGGQDVEVTVLFTDITGFTTIAESMTPAELTEHMSDYFGELIDILERHDATVDKLIGDAVMAFWGAPTPVENHSRAAVEAVLEVRKWLEKANAAWSAKGLPVLPTRFGLASGKVTVGNIGAHHRLNYTALGDPVNLANRLEALNAQLGTSVLADENVRRTAGDDFIWRDVGETEIKGKAASIRVFELLGQKAAGQDTEPL